MDRSALFVLRDNKIFGNLLNHLQGAPLNGSLEVEIREHKPSRSKQQNAYFHALRDLLANELGFEKEDLKQILKLRFLEKKQAIFDGEEVFYVPDTSQLTVKEFSEFIVKTQALCTYYDVRYPSPFYYGVKI